MENLKESRDTLLNALSAFWTKVGESLPMIVSSLLILLIGWIIARILSGITRGVLSKVKFDDLIKRIDTDDIWTKSGLVLTPSQLIGKVVFWVIMLVVFLSTADNFGLESLSHEISNLLNYVPKIIGGLIFLAVGTYFASIVRQFIMTAATSFGLSTAKILSSVVFYGIMAIVIITSLGQLGMDTSILKSNFLLMIGAIFISLSIGYALASRNILQNILSSFFARNTFQIGDYILLDDIEGEIIDKNNLSVIIRTPAGHEVLIPASHLVDNRVTIRRQQ